jgi:hypothetical protein
MSSKINGIPKATIKDPLRVKSEIPKSISLDIIKQRRLEHLRFSFSLLDLQHEMFNCGETHRVKDGWFAHLLNNLSQISNLNFKEFLQQRQHYDLHPIDWDSTACRPHIEGYEQYEFMQFRLSSSTGRVHGYFIENTFYILWLDPHHNLMPDQRFGGIKYFKSPLTPYQILEIENAELKKNVDSLMELLDELTNVS